MRQGKQHYCFRRSPVWGWGYEGKQHLSDFRRRLGSAVFYSPQNTCSCCIRPSLPVDGWACQVEQFRPVTYCVVRGPACLQHSGGQRCSCDSARLLLAAGLIARLILAPTRATTAHRAPARDGRSDWPLRFAGLADDEPAVRAGRRPEAETTQRQRGGAGRGASTDAPARASASLAGCAEQDFRWQMDAKHCVTQRVKRRPVPSAQRHTVQ